MVSRIFFVMAFTENGLSIPKTLINFEICITFSTKNDTPSR